MALVALSGAAFGGLAIFAKLAYAHGADPITVLAVRFVIAGAAMVVLLRASGGRFPRGRLLAGLIALGGVGYVAQSLSFFTALTLASAALVSLLLYVYPAVVTIVAALALGEQLTRVKAGAVVVALAGTALTIGRAGGGTPLGITLGLLSAFAYAGYILVSSRLAPRAGALAASTVVIVAAAAVYTLVAVARGPQLPTAPAGWWALVGMALISTVLAIVTFFAGLERVGPAEASTISTLEPVVTVLLAAVVLGESITMGQIVGGTMILSAVLVLAQAGRGRRSSEPALVPEEVPPT